LNKFSGDGSVGCRFSFPFGNESIEQFLADGVMPGGAFGGVPEHVAHELVTVGRHVGTCLALSGLSPSRIHAPVGFKRIG